MKFGLNNSIEKCLNYFGQNTYNKLSEVRGLKIVFIAPITYFTAQSIAFILEFSLVIMVGSLNLIS